MMARLLPVLLFSLLGSGLAVTTRLRRQSVASAEVVASQGAQQQEFDDSDDSASALMEEGSSTAAQAQAKAPTGVTRPKGWDQCLKFARFTKSQDITGVELVRVWKSTCEPAVQSGAATERYRMMCNALGGAVEPYASQLDYNVEGLCDSVLTVFHDEAAVDANQ